MVPLMCMPAKYSTSGRYPKAKGLRPLFWVLWRSRCNLPKTGSDPHNACCLGQSSRKAQLVRNHRPLYPRVAHSWKVAHNTNCRLLAFQADPQRLLWAARIMPLLQIVSAFPVASFFVSSPLQKELVSTLWIK